MPDDHWNDDSWSRAREHNSSVAILLHRLISVRLCAMRAPAVAPR